MQIDWFTVGAEIVNFLILLYLLKRLLYDRILEVAETREQRIASRFAEAEAEKETAAEKAHSYREQQRELAEKRDDLLAEAQEEAEQRRSELIAEARTAVDQQQEEWQQALNRERERFLRKLNQQAGTQIYAAARRALSDLADVALEKQVLTVFLGRLQQLDEEERTAIRDAMHENDIEVRTAFPLSAEQQQQLIAVLQKELADDLSPQFNVDEDLVCGVALRTDGRQVTWNIAGYLNVLEQQVQETLAGAAG